MRRGPGRRWRTPWQGGDPRGEAFAPTSYSTTRAPRPKPSSVARWTTGSATGSSLTTATIVVGVSSWLLLHETRRPTLRVTDARFGRITMRGRECSRREQMRRPVGRAPAPPTEHLVEVPDLTSTRGPERDSAAASRLAIAMRTPKHCATARVPTMRQNACSASGSLSSKLSIRAARAWSSDPKTAPVASSGSAPLRPNIGRDERNTVPRRPPNTRPCAREGKSNNHRAFTYNHCVPRRTLQFHASPAAACHALEPALLPDERLRQLPRSRPDQRDGQLPHLRVRAGGRPPSSRAATPTRAQRSRLARRSSRTRSSWCR